MTIRLLSTYQGNPPNTVLTLAPAVEAALVAGKNATTDLSGGIPPVYVAPQPAIVTPKLAVGVDGVPIGLVDSNGTIVSVFAGITAPGVPSGLTLTPIAGGVLAAFNPSPTTGGTATTGFEVVLSNGRIQRGTGSPIVINSPAGQAVTATVKQINGYTSSAASAVSNSATPTGVPVPAAPAVLTAAAITGAPTVGAPLSITAATFSGSPAPNVTRTISVGGVVVATGNQSTTYTPVAGDAGKVPSVVEIAANDSGSVTSSASGAAVIAVSAPTEAGSLSGRDPATAIELGTYAFPYRADFKDPKRTLAKIRNLSNTLSMEITEVAAENDSPNASGTWQKLGFTDADREGTYGTGQLFARPSADRVKVMTVTVSNGTVTATCTNHGLANGDRIGVDGAATPQRYFNVRNHPVTVVDPNTFTYQVNAAAGAPTGTLRFWLDGARFQIETKVSI